MKYLKHIIIFAGILLATVSCEKKDDNPQSNEFNVDPYSSVSIDGNLRVRHIAGTANRVVIIASDEKREHITVVSENNVLTITADEDIRPVDDIVVEITAGELEEIRLERDQVAVYEGEIDQEELRVVTEANSELSLLEVRIDRLTSVQEGESVFNLSSWTEEIGDGTEYEEDRIVPVDSVTLIVDSEFLVTGDSVVRSQEEPFVWTVYGDDARQYYLISYADLKTEGNTNINAGGAAIYELQINLEGSSEAEVWVIDRITGKGEGSSTLYYWGSPDVGGFDLEGGAQLIPMN